MTKRREITGFLSLLTPGQLVAALAYTGPDSHGDPAFLTNQVRSTDAPQVERASSRDDHETADPADSKGGER